MKHFFGWIMAVVCAFAVQAQAAPPPHLSAPFDVAAIIKQVEGLRGPVRVSATQPVGRPGTWIIPRRPHGSRDIKLPLNACRFDIAETGPGTFRLRERATGREFNYGGALLIDSSGAETLLPVALEGTELYVILPASLFDTVNYPLVLDPLIGPGFDTTATSSPVVAFDGTNYLLVWYSLGGLFATRVTQEGIVLDPSGIFVATTQVAPRGMSIAFNGSQYLIAWTDIRQKEVQWPTGDGEVLYVRVWRAHFFAARVDADGNALDAEGVLVTNDEQCSVPSIFCCCEYPHASVAVGEDGANFLVAGANNDGLFGARVAPNGSVLGIARSQLHVAANPSIAFDGTNYFVVASDRINKIFGFRFTRGGSLLDPGGLLLGSTASVDWHSIAPERWSSVAFDGTNFLVTWFANGSSLYLHGDLYAQRVTPDGRSIDGGGILIAAQPVSAGGPLTAVYDGRYFVVAWGESGMRLGSDGSLIDAVPWSLGGGFTSLTSDRHGSLLLTGTTQARFVSTWIADKDPPVVSVPPSVWQAATSVDGAVVEFSTSAFDAVYGPLPATCSHPAGSLFPPGVTEVSCTATDPEGNTGSATFRVNVTFDWTGLLAPIAPGGDSVFKLGRRVGVRFALTGASAGITDLNAKLFVIKEGEVLAGAGIEVGTFRFDSASATYILNLSTKALSAGTWRLRADLGDGVEHSTLISLRP